MRSQQQISLIRYTLPAFGPRSHIRSTAKDLFKKFSDTVDGEWPIPNQFHDLWLKLVAGCMREGVALDPDDLARWFFDNGWNREISADVAEAFFKESEHFAKILGLMEP